VYIALSQFSPAGRTIVVCPGKHNISRLEGCMEETPRHRHCIEALERCARPIVLEPGDAFIAHPWLPHRTQPGPGRTYAWYTRFVESGATWNGWNRLSIHDLFNSGTNYCRHDLKPGQFLREAAACFPQVSPLERSATEERFAFDWSRRLCNPQRQAWFARVATEGIPEAYSPQLTDSELAEL